MRQGANQLGLKVTVQDVKNERGLCAHLHRKPRICLGVKGLGIAKYVVQGWKCLQEDVSNGEISEEDIEVDSVEPTDGNYVADGGDPWAQIGFQIPLQEQKKVNTDAVPNLLEMWGTTDESPQKTGQGEIPQCPGAPLKRKRTIDLEDDENNYAKSSKEKMTATAWRIRKLAHMFDKYSVKDTLTLLQKCKENDKDYEFAYLCFSAGNQKMLEEKAALLNSTNDEAKSLIDLFIETSLETPLSPEGYMDIQTTKQTFFEWCVEQSVDSIEFMLQYYLVLTGNAGKKNAVILQGESNAGKTVWLDAMIYMKDLVGFATKSENFAFQGLPGSRICRCDEIQLTPTNVDDWKRLLSGEEFEVQIKCQGNKKVSKLPIFGSCNNAITSFLTAQDKRAVENRMLLIKGLKKSEVLEIALKENEGRKPNPEFFQNILKKMHRYKLDDLQATYCDIIECNENELVQDFKVDVFDF